MGDSQAPLSDLTVLLGSDDQDVCLSVPCRGGRLEEPVKLMATSTAINDLDIVVSPQSLDSNLVDLLVQDSSECFDPETEVGATVTCGEESPEEGQYLVNVYVDLIGKYLFHTIGQFYTI